MKKITGWFYLVLLAVIMGFAGFVFYQNFQIAERIQNIFDQYHIDQKTLHYETGSASLFDDGVIFYKVEFPQIMVKHKIDKMIFTQKDNLVEIQLIGVSLDVIDSLRRTQNIHILSVLNDYQPFEDVFKKPLQTLAVMGIDKIKFNATLVFEPFKNIFMVKGKVTMPFIADVNYRFVINKIIDSQQKDNLVYALNGMIKQASFKIKDKGGFKKYKAYALSRSEDGFLKYDLDKKVFQMDMTDLETPLLLSSIYADNQ